MTRTRPRLIVAALIAGLALPLAGGSAAAQESAAPHRHRQIHLTSQKITLPFSNEVFAGADKTAKIANSHCLLCHSRDLVDYQPPLTLDTWKQEVEKMRSAYGCPLRADQAGDVAAFIAQAAAAGN